MFDEDPCWLSMLPSLFNSLVSELLSESELKSAPGGNEPISPCALEAIVRVHHKTIRRSLFLPLSLFFKSTIDYTLSRFDL